MISPDDIFPKLSGSQIYSTFDFSKGYWAKEKSKDVTTFVTSRGLMRFRVMPFGMENSGSTYNRMVRKLLDWAQSLESYVDDVLGHTFDWETHKAMLRDFFESPKSQLVTQTKQVQNWFFKGWFSWAYLILQAYSKNGATNNQERVSKPSRHDKFLSTLHSKLCWNRCADNRIDEKQDAKCRKVRAINKRKPSLK